VVFYTNFGGTADMQYPLFNFNFIVIKSFLERKVILMTLDCKVDVIQSLVITLKFDDDSIKKRLISVGDLIDVTWNGNSYRKHMIGRVAVISASGTDTKNWYIIVDGADDFASQVQRFSPYQILDCDVIRKAYEDRFVRTPQGDNSCQYIRIVQGRLQYSDDGMNWKYVVINEDDIIEPQEGTVPIGPPPMGPCPSTAAVSDDVIEDAIY
jgi:hypothetical protein